MKPVLILLCLAVVLAGTVMAYAQPPDKGAFEQYRRAISKEYGIDIAKFKEKLSGGRADGKPVTAYDLKQLLAGIKVEQEHTKDRMMALEISMDHLEEIPDYYTRLERMEHEAEKEMEAAKAGTKQGK